MRPGRSNLSGRHGRVCRTGVLFAATASGMLGLAAARAQAQTPENAADPPPLYQTTVTALRLPRPVPDVPATVIVLPREEIDRAPAIATDDILRAVPSAGTFRRTPSLTADPTAQGLNLRGVGPSGVSRALVLLDGIPVNDPFGGWVYWRALPRLSLDRIEIAPGGTSAMYGNYALGGVVQMFSRPIENRIEADAAMGSLGLRTADIAVAGRQGRVGGALEAEGLLSDGYVPVEAPGAIDRRASSRHGTVNGRVEIATSAASKLAAHVHLFDEGQNGGTKYTTAHVRTADFGATFAADFQRWGAVRLAAFGGVQRFRQQRARIMGERAAETLSAEQHVPSESHGASAVWQSPLLTAAGTHTVVIGADARNVAGTTDEALFPASVTAMALVNRRAHGTQRFAGLFVEDMWDALPWLGVFAAARADVWNNLAAERSQVRGSGMEETTVFAARSATEFSPRLGLLLRPLDRTRLRASAYRSFRAPTLNELYRPFQVGTVLTAANEDLAAEHLVGGEIGAEQMVGGAGAVRVTAFWNELRDPIVNATLAMPMPGGPMRQRKNLGVARISGLEASGEARVWRGVHGFASYTLADARVTRNDEQVDLVGKALVQDPVHRAHVGVTYTHPRWITASLRMRAQSRQFEDDLNTLPMAGFAVVDLFAAVPVSYGVEVYGVVQNLFDKRYLVGRAGINTIGPPLIALGGLRLRR